MSFSRIFIRVKSIRTLPVVLVFLVLAAPLALGCSKLHKTVGSIQKAYDRGDFSETVILCERALREGVDGSPVYHYYGLALLALDRDIESFDALKKAAALDGALGEGIAESLVEAGTASFENGERNRAVLRFRAAVEIDEGLDLGRYGFAVAEACFDDREFGRAEAHFAAALDAFPDTLAAEGALFRLAECRSAMGDSLGAIKALEEELRRFPVGSLAVRAEWQLVTLLYENARAEFKRGNYESAAGMLDRVIAKSDNPALIEKSRFLLGECYERLQEFEKAREQYQWVIDGDIGASDRLPARARSKIRTMEESGLLDDTSNELRKNR